MNYPDKRRDFTKEQVKQLLEEQAKIQGWKEIWAKNGWDDVNIGGTICIVTDKPINWSKDLIHWSEDYENEDYQPVFEIYPDMNPKGMCSSAECIWREGEWL